MGAKRYIRASELARWAYCQRAWWLQYVQGHPPMNREALDKGHQAHEALGRQVRHAALYRFLALLLVGVAVLIIALLLLLVF